MDLNAMSSVSKLPDVMRTLANKWYVPLKYERHVGVKPG